MRVLVIKITSLGDVIHTFPALTDAAAAIPGIRFDWVVEEGFEEIPSWHPAVGRVIKVASRRWRRRPWEAAFKGEFRSFIREVRQSEYDAVIDAQGQLGKTAWIARIARGPCHGMDWQSAREPLASLAYHHRLAVPKRRHAVERLRHLFALALDYSAPTEPGDYGIQRDKLFASEVDPRALMFFHGTAWRTKEWPAEYWERLIQLADENGYNVRLTWGNLREKERAESMAHGYSHVTVLGKMSLIDLAREISVSAGIVAVDTGLGHLAAALAVPTVSLYGPTATGLTGAYGSSQHHIEADFECSPCLSRRCTYRKESEVRPACFGAITPDRVWHTLEPILTSGDNRETR